MEKYWEELLEGIKTKFPKKEITLSEDIEVNNVKCKELNYQNGLAKLHISYECLPQVGEEDQARDIIDQFANAAEKTIKSEIQKRLNKFN